ncbi:Germin-like protein 9-3 [Cocos nucifera]|uniref:Germin-like protein n=1 Tax=Cocos nucifera TaxID=13894 RepID=A0A8K0N498_COCNU|nr:Germin-like protein 9-3 [Cocos nucifera]
MASYAWAILAIVLATLLGTHAGDPDITSDFIVPDGVTPDADFFTFKGLKQALRGAPMDAAFKATKASQVEFPALMGQSVSYAVLQFAPGGINPPHTHPRSAELLLVVQGWLQVGLVDSNNTLFAQTLRTGDMFVFPRGLVHFQLLRTGDLFVFPKGLVHFQVNKDPRYPAVALSAFGSANAGTVSLPKTLFGTGIDEDILAKSFKTDAQTIDKLISAATMG